MSRRFTLDGSAALEQNLANLCEKVRHEVVQLVPPRQIESLFLGGGYGRGEGGVLRTASGDLPYNDLEFYVCLRGNPILNERSFSKGFHALSERLSREAGIEVEFKLSSQRKLLRETHTMFFYDLAWGHRVLIGDPLALAGREPDSQKIPEFEATRLMMNRCSGLLYSQRKLLDEPFTCENGDFVGRNQAKAQLAFGDVLLATHGLYHWSCRERHKRLQNLSIPFPLLAQLRCHHALGVEFKLHPQKKSGTREHFLPLQTELLQVGRELWLWLESRRLKQPFDSIESYALSPTDKCPETKAVRNVLINVRRFRSAVFSAGKTFRYPRERLLEALPLLLWEPSTLSSKALLGRVQSNLQSNATSFPALVDDYFKLWQNFN